MDNIIEYLERVSRLVGTAYGHNRGFTVEILCTPPPGEQAPWPREEDPLHSPSWWAERGNLRIVIETTPPCTPDNSASE